MRNLSWHLGHLCLNLLPSSLSFGWDSRTSGKVSGGSSSLGVVGLSCRGYEGGSSAFACSSSRPGEAVAKSDAMKTSRRLS